MSMLLAQSADAHEATLQALRSAECVRVKMLFNNLSAPPMSGLSGDYDAELLDQGSLLANCLIGAAFLTRGNWVGKGFNPQDAMTGVGYNTFTRGGRIIRKLPMRTEMRQSVIDDRESLTINYQYDNRGLICWLTGEVRQMTPHIMLGIGIYQIKLGRFSFKRRLIPFLLQQQPTEPPSKVPPTAAPHSGDQPGPGQPQRTRARREGAALGSV